jgi:hypothetical protein
MRRAAAALGCRGEDGRPQRVAAVAAHDGRSILVDEHRRAGLEDRLERDCSSVPERVVRHLRVSRQRHRVQLRDVPLYGPKRPAYAEDACPFAHSLGVAGEEPDQLVPVADPIRSAAAEGLLAAVAAGRQVDGRVPLDVGRLCERLGTRVLRLLEADRLDVGRLRRTIVGPSATRAGNDGHRDQQRKRCEGHPCQSGLGSHHELIPAPHATVHGARPPSQSFIRP